MNLKEITSTVLKYSRGGLDSPMREVPGFPHEAMANEETVNTSMPHQAQVCLFGAIYIQQQRQVVVITLSVPSAFNFIVPAHSFTPNNSVPHSSGLKVSQGRGAREAGGRVER
ncbi:hypothetical protein E2C01_064869 [Portunus trituberculatus]|uniref:Uncharacterized protein n=1 Tax=Portunus trituberculatus TaxID=210409 RepID=A0A5B7HM05_PORTR|nr:hypothetical protein [Portunus trituberculatus]